MFEKIQDNYTPPGPMNIKNKNSYWVIFGYCNYGKPDTHTIDILFGAGVAASQSNYDIFKTMVKMAKVNNELPAVIDRLLWLIGSGKYVEENEKITRQKAAFIQDIRPKLGFT